MEEHINIYVVAKIYTSPQMELYVLKFIKEEKGIKKAKRTKMKDLEGLKCLYNSKF